MILGAHISHVSMLNFYEVLTGWEILSIYMDGMWVHRPQKNSIHTHGSSCVSRTLLLSSAFMLFTMLDNDAVYVKLQYFRDAIKKTHLNKAKGLTKM